MSADVVRQRFRLGDLVVVGVTCERYAADGRLARFHACDVMALRVGKVALMKRSFTRKTTGLLCLPVGEVP